MAEGTPMMALYRQGGSPIAMDYQDADGRPLTLEEQYAVVMTEVMTDAADAQHMVAKLEAVCLDRAENLRRGISQATHRPARGMHLQALAQEFEAQAASWRLVRCLHCLANPIQGQGGRMIEEAGGRRTARQILADTIVNDPALTRCAAVVAWLETLADDEHAFEGGAASSAARFAEHEGLWLETARRSGQGGVVTEVDPDAPGRQHGQLHPNNTAGEERLLARFWQLVRAGRHADAQALCAACGQGWRAASFAGPVGCWGPLPISSQAERYQQETDQDLQREELACEIETGGPAAPRALWRWACLQAAQQAATSTAPGSRCEAALYGVMAAHLPSILPMCTTWRDHCWAYCRTWLETAADSQLSAEHIAAVGTATSLPLGADDLVVDVVARFSKSSTDIQTVAGGSLSAAAGKLPVTKHSPANATAQSFTEIFDTLRSCGVAELVKAAQEPLCQIQQLLIQDAMSELSQYVFSWLNATVDNSMAVMAEEESALGLPPRPARNIAFGAHLLLALEGLAVLYGAAQSNEDALKTASIRGYQERMIGMYAAALMDREEYHLVPQYLCHVGEQLRLELSHELLSQLTSRLISENPSAAVSDSNAFAISTLSQLQGGQQADDLCRDVYSQMAWWFAHCLERQKKQIGTGKRVQGPAILDPTQVLIPEPLPHNYLQTYVRPHETRMLVNGFLEGVRFSTLTTPAPDAQDNTSSPAAGLHVAPVSIVQSGVGLHPLGRARAARWLYYAHDIREQQPEEQFDEDAYVDALETTSSLMCDLVLGDDSCCEAASHLLTDIIPAGFLSACEELADNHSHNAGQWRIRLKAIEGTPAENQTEAWAQEMASITEQLDLHTVKEQHIMNLVNELQAWQQYCTLERQAQQWQANFNVRQQQGVAPGGQSDRDALLSDGRIILNSLQEQLLGSQWMVAGVPVPDAATLLAGKPTSLMFVVTAPESDDNSSNASYPILKGAALAAMEQQIRESLRSAISSLQASNPSVTSVTYTVTSPATAEGHVTVDIGVNQATPEALQALSALGAGLLQGSIPGIPEVMLVNLCGLRALTLPLAIHCCLAKAVLLCARLRHSLAVLGGDGSDGAGLVEQLVLSSPAVEPRSPLSAFLSPGQLAKVLQLEAETAIQLMANAQPRQ